MKKVIRIDDPTSQEEKKPVEFTHYLKDVKVT